MPWYEWVASVFLAGGAFFALTGAVGILRMPDFYSRLHPAGKSDTMGVVLIMTGLLVKTLGRYSDAAVPFDWTVSTKLLIIIVCVMITAPTATHAITKAAHLDGLQPWRKDGDEDA